MGEEIRVRRGFNRGAGDRPGLEVPARRPGCDQAFIFSLAYDFQKRPGSLTNLNDLLLMFIDATGISGRRKSGSHSMSNASSLKSSPGSGLQWPGATRDVMLVLDVRSNRSVCVQGTEAARFNGTTPRRSMPFPRALLRSRPRSCSAKTCSFSSSCPLWDRSSD